MLIDLNNLISMSDANRNFSSVARAVDQNGIAVIMKNNVPKYIIADFNQFQENQANDISVEQAFNVVVENHKKALEELAK